MSAGAPPAHYSWLYLGTYSQGYRGRRPLSLASDGMRWTNLLTATVITATTLVAGPAAAARDQLQRDADAIRALGITGVQALVTGPGVRRVVTSGVADRDAGRPMPTSGYVRIASVRKALTATVILQLAAERRLSLGDTVERWLPGVVAGNGNDGRRITLRMLLQNTSGIHDDLPGYTTPEEYLEQRYDVHTRDELIARAMRHEPDFAPGTGWGYSNTGILLADAVIERVTGRPYAEAATAHLRLRDAVFTGVSPAMPEPHAAAYQVFPGDSLVDVTEQVSSDPDGIAAPLTELDRFFRALLGGRLLPPAQLAEMKRTVPVGGGVEEIWPDGRYGLGLVSRPLSCGGRRWGHDGGDGGYITVTGTTADGGRFAAVTMTTALGDSLEHLIVQQRAADKLVDDALCSGRGGQHV